MKNTQKTDINELKEKNIELVKKACAYTNLAYTLVEAADTFIMDVNAMLEKVNTRVNNGEKLKLKYALKQGKLFKTNLANFSHVLYTLENAEDALCDADEFYDIMKLIADRCGGSTQILQEIKETIYTSFESKYGYYNKK